MLSSIAGTHPPIPSSATFGSGRELPGQLQPAIGRLFAGSATSGCQRDLDSAKLWAEVPVSCLAMFNI